MKAPSIFRILSFAIVVFSISIASGEIPPSSWSAMKENKKGSITIYWFESRPFIFKGNQGELQGIEYDLMENFKKFLKDQYQVDLSIQWKEGLSFADTYNVISDRQQQGTFGASAFSITPYRKEKVSFSQPYMPDICVLITSNNIPVVSSVEDFNKVFADLTAITIKGTTYERDLIRLKSETNLPFRISYIPSDQNILRTIAKTSNAFGLIDLPVYMMEFNENPSIAVKRQNLFPSNREGYGFIFPKNSDWREPIDAYFNSTYYRDNLKSAIGKYLDIDLYEFIKYLAGQKADHPISLLMKEKEIQSKTLQGKLVELEKGTRDKNFLITLLGIILLSLVVIVTLYSKRNQQKVEIEAHKKDIESKNEQLKRRNLQLEVLDEEKNNLLKILAHDMRTPINHVQGLSQVFLLSNPKLEKDQESLIQNISSAASRLNKMLTNILDIDAIENNRITLNLELVTIPQVIRKVVESFHQQAIKKEINIFITSQNDTCNAIADPLLITQVFENLLSNAIKFSEKKKSIIITIAESQQEVIVQVQDAGPGLTGEDKKVLFKKFQRLSARPTDGENSTGLGLSIVKQYIEAMNGKVWCESEYGKGAIFFVSLKKSFD